VDTHGGQMLTVAVSMAVLGELGNGDLPKRD